MTLRTEVVDYSNPLEKNLNNSTITYIFLSEPDDNPYDVEVHLLDEAQNPLPVFRINNLLENFDEFILNKLESLGCVGTLADKILQAIYFLFEKGIFTNEYFLVDVENLEEESQFLEDKKYILETYAEKLAPRNPECQYAIVVPAYKEFSHLIQLMYSLSTLDEQELQKIEVIYVINNTRQAALDKTPGFEDNQLTLKLIYFVNSQHSENIEDELAYLFPGLTIIQQTAILQFIKKKITIHGIDASTYGINRDHFDRNTVHNFPGLARLIGGCIAYERKNKWIDFIDGDCYLPQNYLKAIFTQLESSTSQAFLKPMYIDLEFPEELQMLPSGTTKLLRMRNLILDTIWFKNSALLFVGVAQGGGPVPITNAELFRKIHGHPYDSDYEDYRYAERTWKHVIPERIQNTGVRVSDRRRPESFFGEYKMSDAVTKEELDTAKLQNFTENQELFTYAIGSKYDWDNYYLNSENRDEYLNLKQKFANQEKFNQAHFLAAFEKLVDKLCVVLERQTNDSAVKLEEIEHDLPEYYLNILQEHKALAMFVFEVAILLKDSKYIEQFGLEPAALKDLVWQYLLKYLPQLFLPYQDEVDIQDMQQPTPDTVTYRKLLVLLKAQYYIYHLPGIAGFRA